MGSVLVNGDGYRCHNCGKLLAKDASDLQSLEIKCARCGTINFLFEKLDDQVIVTDENATVLYVNSAVEKTTGYSVNEIIGKKPSVWGGQMSPDFYKDPWRKIKNNKETVIVRVTNRHESGKLYDAMLRISPILDVNGDIKMYVRMETVVEKATKEKRE